jgi:hypothetical protein
LEEWVVKFLLDTSLEPKLESSLLTLSWITIKAYCFILFGPFGLLLTSTLLSSPLNTPTHLRWLEYPIFQSVCTWYAISLVRALTSLGHSCSLEELKVCSSPFLSSSLDLGSCRLGLIMDGEHIEWMARTTHHGLRIWCLDREWSE